MVCQAAGSDPAHPGLFPGPSWLAMFIVTL